MKPQDFFLSNKSTLALSLSQMDDPRNIIGSLENDNSLDEEDPITLCRKCGYKTKDGGNECGRCAHNRRQRQFKKLQKAVQREQQKIAEEEHRAFLLLRFAQMKERTHQARQTTSLLLRQQLAQLGVRAPASQSATQAPAAQAPATQAEA